MKFAFAEAMHTLETGLEQAEKERREAEKERREAEKQRRQQRKHSNEQRPAQVMQFRKEMQADFQRGHDFFMRRNTAAGQPMRRTGKTHAGEAHAQRAHA